MYEPAHSLILGLGSSGYAAAELLLSEGRAVTVLDRMSNPELETRAEALRTLGAEVQLEAGDLPEGVFDLAVVSPGVPLTDAWMEALHQRAVPAVSELELGWSRRAEARVLAITGSNGKSTAVKWCVEALERDGQRAVPAGNYGPPVSRVVREAHQPDWYVLEVSSFQLETCRQFRPDVGMVLNLNPNHLDRHGDMHTYQETKARMFLQCGADDYAIVPRDWPVPESGKGPGGPTWVHFGLDEACTYYWQPGFIRCGAEALIRLDDTPYDNEVTGPTAAAVTAGLRFCGVTADAVQQSLYALEPLPHRCRLVAEVDGVRYIDDSKATNLAAVSAALERFQGPIRLIAGGILKEKDLDWIKEVLARKVQKVYLIGKAMEELSSAWEPVVPCCRCESLDQAVARAAEDAVGQETVLLSPGCASFDQFRGYAERGRRFAECVSQLEAKEGAG